jgi:probable HAF family extracellular repeat protein
MRCAVTYCKAVLSLAVLLLASVPLALAQGTYTQIDAPGSIFTYCSGINRAGTVVGAYNDTSGNPHGFLLTGGVYTTIDYPGASETGALGLNDEGQIVGYTVLTPNSLPIGFLYDTQTQTFSTVGYPDAFVTEALSINNSGTIAGITNYRGDAWLAFELINSKFELFGPPNTRGAVFSAAISSSGAIAGWDVDYSDEYSNFLRSPQGKYKLLAIPGAPSAQVAGTNPALSAFVGIYVPASGVTAGFLYQNNTLTTLQFPGSNYTAASGINPAGEVVGYFYDASEVGHGFTWTPPADAAKR